MKFQKSVPAAAFITFLPLVLMSATSFAAPAPAGPSGDDDTDSVTIMAKPAPVVTITARPKKSSADDLTEAALQRAHKNSIVPDQVQVTTSSDKVGPIITKPVVTSQPAPGSSAAAAATTPEKARELIMTSHVHVGSSDDTDGGDDSSANSSNESAVPVVLHTPIPATNPAKSSGAIVSTKSATNPAKISTATPTSPKAIPLAASADAKTATVAAAINPKGVLAEQSLKWLTNGNVRYTTRAFRNDGKLAKDRERIGLTGQKPHAIVLSCADSAVPPEVVFDQALGELYTVRTLGEVIDSSSLASLEYAVNYLEPHLLVVMGHTRCDAIQGVMQIKEDQNAGSEFLNKLLSDIRGHLQTFTSEKHSPNFAVESTLNADGVARDLVRRSEIIRKKVESGELVIKTALYRGDTGKVTFY